MSKINNNLIASALILLGILALGIVFALPNNAQAWNGYGFESERKIYSYDDGNNNYALNPIPTITALNSYEAKTGSGAKIITITGKNFIPTSVAKWNGEDRPTSYISSTKLFVHINSKDVSKSGENIITVMNPAPGGGYSNGAVYTVSGNTTNTSGTIRGNDNGDRNNLGANALYADNGFLPNTILGWIFLAIIILLIVIIWRKLYVTDKDRTKPLKHA